MFICIIAMFSNIMYILNTQRIYSDEQRIYDEETSNDFLNSFIMIYTLSFGEFAYEGYNGTNQSFIWLMWFMGSFLIAITFLNMLIAIMSNTYDKVMDNRDLAALKERINIL